MIFVNNIKKSKPVIKDVVISKEKLAELYSELKTSTALGKNKRWIIKRYIGSICTYCGEIPTKVSKCDLEGYGKLVEWYCDKCFERWVEI